MKDLKTKQTNKPQAQKNSYQHQPSKPNTNPQKPANTQSMQPSIIEDIFKTVKKQKQIKKATVNNQQDLKKKKQQEKLKKQWKVEQEMRKANEGNIPSTVRSEGGLKIYSEEELKIGKGGNTRKCPFDCDCCF